MMPRVTVISVPNEVHAAVAGASLHQSRDKQKNFLLGLKNFFDRGKKISWGCMVKNWIWGKNGILLLLSLLVSRVFLLGELDPCGLSLFAVIRRRSAVQARFVAAGVFLGELSLGRGEQAVIYFLAMLAYDRFTRKLNCTEKVMWLGPALLFSTALISSLVMPLRLSLSLYDWIYGGLNAALCLLLYAILTFAFPSAEGFKFVMPKSGMERLIGFAVLATLALAGIGNGVLLGYHPQNIVGNLLVALVACLGGAGPGAALGAAAGLILGLAGQDTAQTIALFTVSGMLSGLFRPLGKYAVVFGYLLGYTLVMFMIGSTLEPDRWLLETALACLPLLVLSDEARARLGQKIGFNNDLDQEKLRLSQTSKKLKELAAIFADMGQAFGGLCGKDKEKIKENEIQSLLALVGDEVCRDCSQREFCWTENFYQSYEGLLEMAAQAESGGLRLERLPLHFKQHCQQSRRLLNEVLKVQKENQSYFYWHNKLYDTRQMVTEQMKALSTILASLHTEINREPQENQTMACRLAEEAKKLACPLITADVTKERQTTCIEICKTACSGNEECRHTLLPLASGLFSEPLTLTAECGNPDRKKLCRITLKTAERLALSVGVATLNKDKNAESGDSHLVSKLPGNKTVLLLSDGMGSGCEAQRESAMAVRFLEKLLKAGFAVDVAVKTANAMLLVQNPSETFSTIDLAVVNAYSGETDFIKIGAAPSYIKRVREVAVITASSTPAGMIEPLEFRPVTVQLTAGDIIVMVSDGVSDSGAEKRDDWVVNYLRRLDTDVAQVIADSLLAEAKRRSGQQVKDDMTVLVAKLLPFQ